MHARVADSAISNDADADFVSRALAGCRAARRELVLRSTPVVQQRVSRPLARFGAARGRRVDRSEVLDLVQQVLLVLFDRDGRVLRSWDPGRGLSLMNFIGLVAEREAKAILRSGRRSAWAEEPTSGDELCALAMDEHVLEDEVASREELLEIWQKLEAALSPRNLELFRALLVDELSIEEASARFSMSPNALYTFRSRLRQQVQAIRASLTPAEATTHAAPRGARLVARQPALERNGPRSVGGDS
jgi:RNA polymerase sigma-70 factor (ECF subfamily)